MRAQAKKGGETGVNGQFYKGGEFLPSSKHTVKGAQSSRISTTKVRKVEIANRDWVDSRESEGLYSIYKVIGMGVLATWAQGKWGTEIQVATVGKPVRELSNEKKARLVELIQKWNDGERFTRFGRL